MVDSGSLFLGLTLAAFAITREDQASNVFAVVGVPTLIFLLPILDTAMVSLTRLLRGQSPTQGGRDHSSHRLVALGLSERQTLLVLMGIALLSGLSAVFLEAWSYTLSLILIPLVVLIFTLFSAYLGQLKVVGVDQKSKDRRNTLTNWLIDLTYRRRILEVLLDFFQIAFAYYLAHLAQFGLPLGEIYAESYLLTMPIAIAATLLSFAVFGIYRGVWRYVSLDDAFGYVKAVASGMLLSAAVIWVVFRSPDYSWGLYLLYGLLLLFIMMASRFSFRLLDQLIRPAKTVQEELILIYGAGDAGELALKECLQNKELGYNPAGFLDDDPLKKGRRIHGLTVFGGLDELSDLIESHQIEGVIIASSAIDSSGVGQRAVDICKQSGVWVRRLRLEFEDWA